MKNRDTITDFVQYLSKKEALVESGRLLSAAGEDDLLAYYLRHVDDQGEHQFTIPSPNGVLAITQGEWESFSQSPARKSQIEADADSYLWDYLIERFSYHFISRTADYCSHSTYSEHESLLRFFARESRLRRRMLAKSTSRDRWEGDVRPIERRESFPLCDQAIPFMCSRLLRNLRSRPMSNTDTSVAT